VKTFLIASILLPVLSKAVSFGSTLPSYQKMNLKYRKYHLSVKINCIFPHVIIVEETPQQEESAENGSAGDGPLVNGVKSEQPKGKRFVLSSVVGLFYM